MNFCTWLRNRLPSSIILNGDTKVILIVGTSFSSLYLLTPPVTIEFFCVFFSLQVVCLKAVEYQNNAVFVHPNHICQSCTCQVNTKCIISTFIPSSQDGQWPVFFQYKLSICGNFSDFKQTVTRHCKYSLLCLFLRQF